MVADARTGCNAGIRNLQRAANASGLARRERVDSDDRLRMNVMDDSLYDFRRFHTGDAQHAGRDRADRAHAL